MQARILLITEWLGNDTNATTYQGIAMKVVSIQKSLSFNRMPHTQHTYMQNNIGTRIFYEQLVA